mgnify:CR=1 FL=1
MLPIYKINSLISPYCSIQFVAGIPPHISLLSEMKGMKEDFKKMKESLMADFKRELDEQSIGGAEFLNMKTLMDKMDGIEQTLQQKLEKRLFSEHDFVSTAVEEEMNAEPIAVASEATTVLFRHNKNTAFNLYFNIGGTTRKLPKGYIFPSMGLHSLIISWYCGDLSKRISPFMLVPWKDCVNDAQKCLISTMKGMMEIVVKATRQKGVWKSDNYYMGSVERCTDLFEEVEELLRYPGVTHVQPHEESSYLTVMDL